MTIFKTQNKIKPWIDSLANLIFPPICPGCKNPLLSDEKWLCVACEIKLPVAPYLLQNDNPIVALFKGRIKIEFGTSFLIFTKNGLAQNLIHELKYSDNTKIGERLGFLFGELLKGHVELPDALIPVPLHPNKEKKRGYNQSFYIAKGLSKSLGIPVVTDAVKRTVENISQTKLNRYKRWENVKNIFSIDKKHAFKYVWIIDDTLTTGSTLEACANVFIKDGSVKIGMATLAYAY